MRLLDKGSIASPLGRVALRSMTERVVFNKEINTSGKYRSCLLDWFYASRRILPFREDPTPYHVWLSEIMLQQTRVSAALPYYERFLAALPDIPALADVRRKSCTSCGGAGLLQPGAQFAEGSEDRLRSVRRAAAC